MMSPIDAIAFAQAASVSKIGVRDMVRAARLQLPPELRYQHQYRNWRRDHYEKIIIAAVKGNEND